jgi:hypothetical protein
VATHRPFSLAGCVAFLLLATLLAACDKWEGVTVRNDGPEPLTIVPSIPGGREFPLAPALEPGKTVDAGFVEGGPPDPPFDIIVKAFDPRGALVYCRRFTPPEQQPPSSKNPISIKPGDLRCK